MGQLVLHYRYIFNGDLNVRYLSMIDVLGSLNTRLSEERVVDFNAMSIARTVEDFMTKEVLSFEILLGVGMMTLLL